MDCINLVPSGYKKLMKRRKYISWVTTSIILGTIGLMFLAFLPKRYIQIQQKDLALLEQLLNQNDLKEVKNLIQEIEESDAEKLNMQVSLAQIDTPSYITRTTMDMIVDSSPKGLRINEVIIEGLENLISIRGQAMDIKSIAAYTLALSHTFDNITYTTYRKQSGETKQLIDYHLEIKLNPVVDVDLEEVL